MTKGSQSADPADYYLLERLSIDLTILSGSYQILDEKKRTLRFVFYSSCSNCL